jgi:predicted PurR-regulated permease PerM
MHRDWQSILLRLAVILAALLVVLASLVLLSIFFQVLQRFGNVVVLFTLGAIVAYVLNPAVNRATAMLGKRWAGMLAVYGGVMAFLVILAVLLFQPLLTQSSSLMSALRNPSAGSLRTLDQVTNQANLIGNELRSQELIAATGGAIPNSRAHRVQADIAAVQNDLAALETGPARSVPDQGGRRHDTAPQLQIRIPPSYLAPLQAATATLASDYGRAVPHNSASARASLTRTVSDAGRIASAARVLHSTVSATPILVLDAQVWADQRHIDVNVRSSAGQAVKKITDQAASILNNTTSILTTTGTLLVDAMLILLISLYFVSDGARMIPRGLELVPDQYRKQATFFVDRMDSVLGKSIRANLALAALAGVLGGGGAMVLGVPYAVLIGISTFVLELVPIIGPVVLVIPPFVIALLFTTPTKAIILLIWYIVFQQIVTNVIGPRLTSKTVGIHPLEAMAAALIGYPLAGILGSFLAVPVVGLAHVLAKQAYASWKAKKSTAQTGDAGVKAAPPETGTPASEGVIASTPVYATGQTEA